MKIKTSIGNIEASKDVLNILSCDLAEASESYEKRGRLALCRDARNLSNEIYYALDAVGYYDSVRK